MSRLTIPTACSRGARAATRGQAEAVGQGDQAAVGAVLALGQGRHRAPPRHHPVGEGVGAGQHVGTTAGEAGDGEAVDAELGGELVDVAGPVEDAPVRVRVESPTPGRSTVITRTLRSPAMALTSGRSGGGHQGCRGTTAPRRRLRPYSAKPSRRPSASFTVPSRRGTARRPGGSPWGNCAPPSGVGCQTSCRRRRQRKSRERTGSPRGSTRACRPPR